MNRSTTASRRFKRLSATVALGAALGLSLVACGDDGDSGTDASDDESSSAAAPTEETFGGRARVHGRQVRGWSQQRRLVLRGRHPAADRQPRLPRAPGCRRCGSGCLRHQRGRWRQRRQGLPQHPRLRRLDRHVDLDASAGTMVAGKPSVVIGAESSSVSLNFVDTLADAKITEVSPANTATTVRLLAVVLPHRPAGHRPGQRARHADQPGRLHQRRLPGVQRHLRHRPAQRHPEDRRGRRWQVRLRLQG